MNPIIKEIEKNLPDYEQFVAWFNQHTYTNKSIEECQRWELREALSYYFHRNSSDKLIVSIANSIQSPGKKVTWNPLSLVDEAKLQYNLRSLGIEIQGIDQWPTDNVAFETITHKISIERRFNYQVINQILSRFNLKNLYFLLEYKTLVLYILLGCIFFDFHLLVYGICLGFLLWIPADVIRHEYIEHSYIKPKNKIFEFFIELYIQTLVPSTHHDRSGVVGYHQTHHRLWKTDQDLFTKRVENEFVPGLKDYDISYIRKNKNDKSPFRYLTNIKVLALILLICATNISTAVFLVLLPYTLVNILNFQHDWYLSKFGERNYPWMFPLALNQSWHYEHHKRFKKIPNSVSDLFMGPSWVKYINPQYYFAIIFFKSNTGVSR